MGDIILHLGPRLKDHILLIDLGCFKYLFFDRIARYGGYFVSRLKVNANPMIVLASIVNGEGTR